MSKEEEDERKTTTTTNHKLDTLPLDVTDHIFSFLEMPPNHTFNKANSPLRVPSVAETVNFMNTQIVNIDHVKDQRTISSCAPFETGSIFMEKTFDERVQMLRLVSKDMGVVVDKHLETKGLPIHVETFKEMKRVLERHPNMGFVLPSTLTNGLWDKDKKEVNIPPWVLKDVFMKVKHVKFEWLTRPEVIHALLRESMPLLESLFVDCILAPDVATFATKPNLKHVTVPFGMCAEPTFCEGLRPGQLRLLIVKDRRWHRIGSYEGIIPPFEHITKQLSNLTTFAFKTPSRGQFRRTKRKSRHFQFGRMFRLLKNARFVDIIYEPIDQLRSIDWLQELTNVEVLTIQSIASWLNPIKLHIASLNSLTKLKTLKLIGVDLLSSLPTPISIRIGSHVSIFRDCKGPTENMIRRFTLCHTLSIHTWNGKVIDLTKCNPRNLVLTSCPSVEEVNLPVHSPLQALFVAGLMPLLTHSAPFPIHTDFLCVGKVAKKDQYDTLYLNTSAETIQIFHYESIQVNRVLDSCDITVYYPLECKERSIVLHTFHSFSSLTFKSYHSPNRCYLHRHKDVNISQLEGLIQVVS